MIEIHDCKCVNELRDVNAVCSGFLRTRELTAKDDQTGSENGAHREETDAEKLARVKAVLKQLLSEI